ncbi:unnamed protein product [Gadus morhua 'NCC']
MLLLPKILSVSQAEDDRLRPKAFRLMEVYCLPSPPCICLGNIYVIKMNMSCQNECYSKDWLMNKDFTYNIYLISL